jgi:outer membrane receptor protein involved in Fe transport
MGLRVRAWAMSSLAIAMLVVTVSAAAGAVTGKIQGKIVGTDTGEPIAFADVLLLPADTTMHKVGGLTNADGTFLLEAAPGRYTLQIRALSYATKRVDGLVIEAGQLMPYNTALSPEAIKQQEIVVEAKAQQNTDASLLTARKKATSLGDAISAEQVHKSPDKNAAEMLRRVTGLSVSDGKYVFVRGLGERYSSTEIDGVRIASPEQNKRVVPLDLIPANLLDNVVVQKTYTADRQGEFGGGDVQLHTKDFPGNRTWFLSIQQGFDENITFQQRGTYSSTRADIFGFGSDSRKIPDEVYQTAGERPLTFSPNPSLGFTKPTLANVAKSFDNVWTPYQARTLPNSQYAATYGNEYKLLGRPLGLILSGSFNRTMSHREESQRLFQAGDTLYDYAVTRYGEAIQIGGLSALSYRVSPRHTLHLRGFYTNSADDEVRFYEGQDHNRIEAQTGTWIVHRNTRLMYVQRDIVSAALDGQHQFPHLLGTGLDWKLTSSQARRQQPDRREFTYDRGFYPDADGNLVEYWSMGGIGRREYGDLKDNGWGGTANGTLPYRLGRLGAGKLVLGYDHQTKKRTNFYRRFDFVPARGADRTAPPESLYDQSAFSGDPNTGYVNEATLEVDNYEANQDVDAGFVSLDVPLGRGARANLGLRREDGSQDVRTFNLFYPDQIITEGKLSNQDWLPSGNVTWGLTSSTNLRLAASRSLSRPDLNELSPSPSLEYVAGYQVQGNPDLQRALIDNYDARLEAFPGISEVLAVGYFYKHFHEPIEQVFQGGAPPILIPRNSDHGDNRGVEVEARTGLGRVWKRLRGLSVNANASVIKSSVVLKPQLTELTSGVHPLQGQANYLANGVLTYTSGGGRTEASVLLGLTGKRLAALGLNPEPDIYEQPSGTLDFVMSFTVLHNGHFKLSAKNLLDPRVQQLAGDGREVSGYRMGRVYSITFSTGS